VHFGYGEARHRGGDAVPRRTVRDVFAPLGPVLAEHGVRALVIAGDLFEAGVLPNLPTELRAWCESAEVKLTVVPGNHDRGLSSELPTRPKVVLGEWLVVHGDGDLPDAPIVQGHEHPCFRWSGGIDAPCYLVGKRRLVMPAFSPDAAGVNVVGMASWRDFQCAVIGGDGVLDFGMLAQLNSA
jgi:putative SbcD/Mre11-related phosphoesterase